MGRNKEGEYGCCSYLYLIDCYGWLVGLQSYLVYFIYHEIECKKPFHWKGFLHSISWQVK